MKNLLLFLIIILFSYNVESNIVCNGSSYIITENITIYSGEIYNGWTISGYHTRTLKSILGCDSTVNTNLVVINANIKYNFSVTPNNVSPEDKVLFGLYLNYSNKLVLDTIDIVGYSTPLIKSGNNLTKTIVINSRNNYNQYRFSVYKNFPSKETRIPVMPKGKTITWCKISYYVLQRLANITDFNASYHNLPLFGEFPITIKKSDYVKYNEYLIMCNKMVLDTINIVGYSIIPLKIITYSQDLKDSKGNIIRPKGVYLTQNLVFDSRKNYNQYRYKTYKNIPSTEKRVPIFPSNYKMCWTQISYYVLQRKPSVIDFNNTK